MYWVNGHLQSTMEVADRGFQYGDGLFETVLFVEGCPLLWGEHIERLRLGCQRLSICYEVEPDRLLAQANQLIDIRSQSGQPEYALRCILKVMVTRGPGGRGYRPGEGVSTEVLGVFPPPDLIRDFYTRGVELRSLTTPVSENIRLAGLKHLNRLEQVLASLELDDNEFEGVMHNSAGDIIEGTKSNICVKVQGNWLTPDLQRSGVKGVLREYLLSHAAEWGIKVDQAQLGQAELADAEAMIIMNSVFGVIPVSSFNHQLLDVSCAIKEIQIKIHQNLPFVLI